MQSSPESSGRGSDVSASPPAAAAAAHRTDSSGGPATAPSPSSRPPRLRCEICSGASSDEFVLSCKVCKDCNVHPSCYGVNIDLLPDGASDDSIRPAFTCLACSRRAPGQSSSPSCALCGQSGGALKPTERGKGEWAHIICALFIPECWIDDNTRPNTVCGFDYIPASRKSKACAICKKRVGYCVPCSWSGRSSKTSKSKGCDTSPFHVFCASRAGALGYRVKLKAVDSGDDDFSVAKLMHCPTHSVARFDPKAWLAEQRKARRDERSDPTYWDKLKQSAKEAPTTGSKGKKKGKTKRKRSGPTATATEESAASSSKSVSPAASDNASVERKASWLKPLPTASPAVEGSGDEGKSDVSDGEAGKVSKKPRLDAATPSSASAVSSAAAASSSQASVKSPADLHQFYQRVLHTEAAVMADKHAQLMGAIIMPPPRFAPPSQASSTAASLPLPADTAAAAATTTATAAAAAAAVAASASVSQDSSAASFRPPHTPMAELGAGSALAVEADAELQHHLDPLPPLLPLFNSEGEMSEFSVLAQVSHRVLSPLVPAGGARAGTPSVVSRVGSSPSPLGEQRPRPAAAASFSTPSRPDEHIRAFDGKENAGSLLLNISRSTISPPFTPARGTSFTFQTPTRSGAAAAAVDLHMHTPGSLQSFDTPPEVAAAEAAAKALDAAAPKQPAALPSSSSTSQQTR